MSVKQAILWLIVSRRSLLSADKRISAKICRSQLSKKLPCCRRASWDDMADAIVTMLGGAAARRQCLVLLRDASVIADHLCTRTDIQTLQILGLRLGGPESLIAGEGSPTGGCGRGCSLSLVHIKFQNVIARDIWGGSA